MSKIKIMASCIALTAALTACRDKAPDTDTFDYHVDRFEDIEVLRYKVPDFENLSLDQKRLVYHLTEAALAGRDILWDQNCKYNLPVRRLLENIYVNYDGDREDPEFKAFETYLKQVWFANGLHHHYSMDKFTPKFSQAWFETEMGKIPRPAHNREDLLQAEQAHDSIMLRYIFDPTFMAKRVSQDASQDVITASAMNMYDGVTQQQVEDYYAKLKDPSDPTPVSYGLNTRVTLDADGNVIEQQYRIGGLYSKYIERIVDHLEQAAKYAENDTQLTTIQQLIDYYKTGDLRKFDEYSITWTGDTLSTVDFINGFIESYGDPLGMTGSWESIVNFKNHEASERTETLSANAQWFEDNSPVDPKYRKPHVKGVSAKVITAAILAGDAYPATPIGINLPNANWIRAAHGSKSVTIENITQAYDAASHGNGFNEEFVPDAATRELLDKYLFITDNLHTDLHECLGHGSGRLMPGVDPDALKVHGSTLEETRADLFALYYLADPKLIELGLLDNPDAYKAEYYKYMLNGLMTQLQRIEPGKEIEEAHMRNRALIARWALEHGAADNVVAMEKHDGKTVLVINDYQRLRDLFGRLLGEIQRIKSEGDYQAGADLVDRYAVAVDPDLHREILDRYATLSIAPYKGFVNPVYTPVTDADGNITDVTIDYTESYPAQMLRYSGMSREL